MSLETFEKIRAMETSAEAGTLSDPVAAFNSLISEYRQGGKSYIEALSRLMRENPAIHAAYLHATNEGGNDDE